MASRQGASRALAVLRVGNILLHVNELDGLREVVRAIATPYNLHGPSDVAAARQVPADAEPELATTAAEILACAVAATTVLGSATLAKGMAAARTGMASALKRDLRQLDGAAALLRHPGTAAALLARLRTWRSLTAQGISSPGDGQRSNDDTAASLCVHGTSGSESAVATCPRISCETACAPEERAMDLAPSVNKKHAPGKDRTETRLTLARMGKKGPRLHTAKLLDNVSTWASSSGASSPQQLSTDIDDGTMGPRTRQRGHEYATANLQSVGAHSGVAAGFDMDNVVKCLPVDSTAACLPCALAAPHPAGTRCIGIQATTAKRASRACQTEGASCGLPLCGQQRIGVCRTATVPDMPADQVRVGCDHAELHTAAFPSDEVHLGRADMSGAPSSLKTSATPLGALPVDAEVMHAATNMGLADPQGQEMIPCSQDEMDGPAGRLEAPDARVSRHGLGCDQLVAALAAAREHKSKGSFPLLDAAMLLAWRQKTTDMNINAETRQAILDLATDQMQRIQAVEDLEAAISTAKLQMEAERAAPHCQGTSGTHFGECGESCSDLGSEARPGQAAPAQRLDTRGGAQRGPAPGRPCGLPLRAGPPAHGSHRDGNGGFSGESSSRLSVLAAAAAASR